MLPYFHAGLVRSRYIDWLLYWYFDIDIEVDQISAVPIHTDIIPRMRSVRRTWWQISFVSVLWNIGSTFTARYTFWRQSVTKLINRVFEAPPSDSGASDRNDVANTSFQGLRSFQEKKSKLLDFSTNSISLVIVFVDCLETTVLSAVSIQGQYPIHPFLYHYSPKSSIPFCIQIPVLNSWPYFANRFLVSIHYPITIIPKLTKSLRCPSTQILYRESGLPFDIALDLRLSVQHLAITAHFHIPSTTKLSPHFKCSCASNYIVNRLAVSIIRYWSLFFFSLKSAQII